MEFEVIEHSDCALIVSGFEGINLESIPIPRVESDGFELLTIDDAKVARGELLEELCQVTPGLGHLDYYDMQSLFQSNYRIAHHYGFWGKLYAARNALKTCKQYWVSVNSAIYWSSAIFQVYTNRDVIVICGKIVLQFLI